MKSRSFRSRLMMVFAGELANKIFVTASFIWLAHTLDTAAYGDVEWALSITMMFLLAGDTGLTTWAAARIAAEPERAHALVVEVALVRLALAVPAYMLLLIVAMTYGGGAGTALAIYGLVLFLQPLFLQYLFNGLLQPRWAALGQAIRGATFAIGVLLLATSRSAPSVAAVAEVLGAATLALCNLLIIRYAFNMRLQVRPQRKDLLALLRQSWPVGASDLTWGVHWYSGVIVLGYLATAKDAAWHSAALRLTMSLHTIVWLYHVVLLPNLARLVVSDATEWRQLVERSLRLAGWMGCGIALTATLAARTILTTVFGLPFAAAVPGFQIAIWIVPISWISGHFRYSLIAAHHPKKEYHAALLGAATTIMLTLVLGASQRSLGAGAALMIGTMTTGITAVVMARRLLPALALGNSLAASTTCCVGCLVLGVTLTSVAGEVLATLASVAVFTTFAVYAERHSAKAIVGQLIGDVKLSMTRTDIIT